jgi:hypothetical protein
LSVEQEAKFLTLLKPYLFYCFSISKIFLKIFKIVLFFYIKLIFFFMFLDYFAVLILFYIILIHFRVKNITVTTFLNILQIKNKNKKRKGKEGSRICWRSSLLVSSMPTSEALSKEYFSCDLMFLFSHFYKLLLRSLLIISTSSVLIWIEKPFSRLFNFAFRIIIKRWCCFVIGS